MKTITNISLLLLLLLGVQPVAAQVKVEGRLSATTIPIGDQTQLKLTVTAKPGTAVVFPSYKSQQQMVEGVEVVEMSNDSTTEADGMSVTWRSYTLTAWDGKKYNLPQLKVKVAGKDYFTNSIPLTVTEEAVDSLSSAQMRPQRDILDNPYMWSEWSPLFWLSILALLCGAACYYLYLRLRGNKPVISRIRFVKKQLPHQKAMQEIEQIKTAAAQGAEDQKVYFTRLTDALRQYLEDRFDISAKEMTSSEIIFRLQKEEDQQKIDELRQVFETADLVKFAKYSTGDSEKEHYMTQVVEFIQTTKIEKEAVVEKIKDELTDEQKRGNRSRMTVKVAATVLLVASLALIVYIAVSAWQLIG